MSCHIRFTIFHPSTTGNEHESGECERVFVSTACTYESSLVLGDGNLPFVPCSLVAAQCPEPRPTPERKIIGSAGKGPWYSDCRDPSAADRSGAITSLPRRPGSRTFS